MCDFEKHGCANLRLFWKQKYMFLCVFEKLPQIPSPRTPTAPVLWGIEQGIWIYILSIYIHPIGSPLASHSSHVSNPISGFLGAELANTRYADSPQLSSTTLNLFHPKLVFSGCGPPTHTHPSSGASLPGAPAHYPRANILLAPYLLPPGFPQLSCKHPDQWFPGRRPLS